MTSGTRNSAELGRVTEITMWPESVGEEVRITAPSYALDHRWEKVGGGATEKWFFTQPAEISAIDGSAELLFEDRWGSQPVKKVIIVDKAALPPPIRVPAGIFVTCKAGKQGFQAFVRTVEGSVQEEWSFRALQAE